MDVNIDEVIMMAHESFRNENGIMIKKCCASCKMRMMNSEAERICMRYKKKIDSDDYCKKWVLSPKLQNAGLGLGKVKSRRYLTYFRERWIEQRDALIEGRIDGTQMRCAGEIRQEYDKEYGSIFVEI